MVSMGRVVPYDEPYGSGHTWGLAEIRAVLRDSGYRASGPANDIPLYGGGGLRHTPAGLFRGLGNRRLVPDQEKPIPHAGRGVADAARATDRPEYPSRGSWNKISDRAGNR